MKTTKINICILLFISISVISGCSEKLITPGGSIQDLNSNSVPKTGSAGSKYSELFKLAPGQSIKLDYGNTNLVLIQSYSVSNCSIDKKDLMIRSSNQAGSESLPCSWKKSGFFTFEDLSVTNIGKVTRVVSVYLEGETLNK